jgi:DNA-directed RNA polymerase subunit RPC12/RpoP
MNYLKITYNIFVVKNQNGFNNALYDFMDRANSYFSKQELRSMVTDFPKSYPAAVIFHKEYDIGRISVEVLDKNEVSTILESFEKFDSKPETNLKVEHHTTKCEHCLSVFEYNSSELEEEEERDMSGYHYYYYTRCPICGNRILVKAVI